VSNATIATEIHQSLDIHGELTPQIAFNNEICNRISQLDNFGFREILYLCLRCNASRLTNLLCARIADSVDRGQRDHDMLVDRYVYACYSSHFNYLLISAAS